MKIRWNNPLRVNADHVLYPDFRLTPCRLIIEIDGPIHWFKAADWDCKRDFWFEERGYRVLHIPNREAETMTEQRLADAILAVYPSFPNPTPEMEKEHDAYRKRLEQISSWTRTAIKKKRMTPAQRRFVQMQKESWKQWKERPSAPCEKQGDRAISLTV